MKPQAHISSLKYFRFYILEHAKVTESTQRPALAVLPPPAHSLLTKKKTNSKVKCMQNSYKFVSHQLGTTEVQNLTNLAPYLLLIFHPKDSSHFFKKKPSY